MEKGGWTQESAPPYPGPPLGYGAAPPPPVYPSAPPPVGYQPVPQPAFFPQQAYAPPPPPPPGPPAPMYHPGPVYAPVQAPRVTVTTTQVFSGQSLREFPGQTVCPRCQLMVVSHVEHVTGGLTWLIAALLFIVGCIPCCCIPFCVDSCKDVEHRCPSCRSLIHTHRRM